MPQWAYSGRVARWEKFKAVNQVLNESLPEHAIVTSVEVSGDSSVVVIHTLTPGLVIGRRGETADRVRDALSASIGSPVQLRIMEDEGPSQGPPSGGVREPRSPLPNSPPEVLHKAIEE